VQKLCEYVYGHHALDSRMNHLIEEKPIGIFRRKRRFNMRTHFPLNIFGRFIFIIRSYTFEILMEIRLVQNVTKNLICWFKILSSCLLMEYKGIFYFKSFFSSFFVQNNIALFKFFTATYWKRQKEEILNCRKKIQEEKKE